MGCCGVILTLRFVLEVFGCVPDGLSAAPVEEAI
jgi:hypothetical protein